jgi:membrane-bound lytic murein transglycosylase F
MTQRATGFLLAPLLGALLVFQQGCTDTTELAPLETANELVVVTRNTPTTYYFDGDRASGFDYALVKQFALEQDLSLRIKVAFSLPELFEMLATGEAHIAAAGLSQSPSRDAQFLASIAYMEQQPLLVYKSGGNRPRVVDDLVARDIIVVAGSVHVELLTALKEELPELSWREIHAADSLELMQLITHDKAELAIVDSREFSTQQTLFPRVVAAMEIGHVTPVVWYLPRTEQAESALITANQFIERATKSGFLTELKQQHFDRYNNVTRVGSLTFQRKIRDDLPKWRSLLEEIAAEYQMDWRLLAAMAYQESHWNPNARSHTGVRGMMMLTQATAAELGVDDRTDVRQSLRGGARFFKDLLRRLPSDILEPDRTSMALAAYTIGMGHLEDARVITERSGGDPHLWLSVRAQLPKLQNPEFFSLTKFGFAEGATAVTYVDNIRHYEGMLALQDLSNSWISPPIKLDTLLPPRLNETASPVL